MQRITFLLMITSGCMPAYERSRQDATRAPSESDFHHWLVQQNQTEEFNALKDHLASADVGHVFETWHLLRQGTDWREVGLPPFAIPPQDLWDGMDYLSNPLK